MKLNYTAKAMLATRRCPHLKQKQLKKKKKGREERKENEQQGRRRSSGVLSECQGWKEGVWS